MRKILLTLLTTLLCSVTAWGAASTTSDGKFASGTIDFSTIGSLSATTTYWHNGVKFYTGESNTVSDGTGTWSTSVSIPAYISEKTASNSDNKGKWGKNGSGKQYTMSGFACNQHTVGIHVNAACTITVVVNRNLATDTDDAGISATIDGTAYGTAWTSSTYKTAGTDLSEDISSSREDATNEPGRYTLTIIVTEDDLTDGEAVIKMFYGSGGTGSGKLFCYESITISTGSCTDVGISTQPTSPVAAIVGSASSITGLVASGTSPSYQWYTCNSDGSGAAAISAAGAMSFTGYTTATLGLTPTAAGTTYYKCVVSGECGDPVTSNVVTVNAATAYTLTWNLNGGKVTTAGTGAAVDATGTPSIALVAGAAITTPEVAKDYHDFDDWDSEPASTMPASNTTYTAQWTALYATGTYTFENNASAGTAPNKLTMTDDNKPVDVAAGSRVDNLFFSAQSITYESGVYGSGADDYKGWKIKTDGATISFLVENDCDVTFGVGTINGAVVSYTNQSGTPVDNSALTAKTDNTFSVKGGTVVTFKTTTASTNTLKKIAITAACTSHSVTAATSTGNNTYGTVSAASASVCEGSTTTVTAVPAAGYQVTNWAVSGTGASVSPSGASNSNTTTLTMGTANATVTVTFGCVSPTSPSISGTTAYTEGQDISLTADASDKSASATYTWYKGEEWDDASATSSIHSGATLSIDDCVEDNAGTYWCNISNGTGCDAHVSKAITVGPACTDPDLTITLN